MFKKMLTAALLAAAAPVAAQTLITFAGGTFTGSTAQATWAAGEIIIQTATAASSTATQGFLQPHAEVEKDTSNDQIFTTVNVITPDGDGTNDIFTIEDALELPQNLLIVFNRWGEVVFRAEPYRNDWAGDRLPTAAYFYYFYPIKGEKKLYRGSIHLFRN